MKRLFNTTVWLVVIGAPIYSPWVYRFVTGLNPTFRRAS